MIAGTLSLVKGLLVTIKNLLTPAVTVQYPTEKLPMHESYRGLADLHIDKCIACNQCVKICPTGCLFMGPRVTPEKKKVPETFTYKMELCCFCGLCEQVCPTSAIYLNKIYEIAVYDRKKLFINLMDPHKYDEWANPTVK